VATAAAGPHPTTRRVDRVRTFRLLTTVAAATLVAGACGVDVGVSTERADPIAPVLEAPPTDAQPPGAATGDPVPPTSPLDTTDEPTSSAPHAPVPPSTPPTAAPDDERSTEPGITDPGTIDSRAVTPGSIDPGSVDRGAIDFGPDKPAQPYDDYLLAAVSDIETWWSEQFPAVYGSSFDELGGRIIAAYPGRPDEIPGCGEPRTTYEEVREFAAFYCAVGDFMVYDDADDGLLATLADRFGPATIAIVLAHEYGHAVQLRVGALDTTLPTITTEQQADCFAGAWSARVAGGQAAGLVFSDDDIRAGLISMLEVRDPVGVNQFSPGSHGSGFDRVNAFQEGFLEGVGRCSELLDDPLPLSPADFFGDDGGNAPWGYSAESELFPLLANDLNLYWGSDVAATATRLAPLTTRVVRARSEVDCDRLGSYFDRGAALCLEDDRNADVVFVNEPAAYDLYSQELFGDFSIGYLLGMAWADAAQRALGSTRAGVERQLIDDCLTGAWVQTDILAEDPDTGLLGLPEPRHPDRQTRISPGDRDETIRTMILVGDASTDVDEVGTPFEKIAAFRDGLIGGVDICLARI